MDENGLKWTEVDENGRMSLALSILVHFRPFSSIKIQKHKNNLTFIFYYAIINHIKVISINKVINHLN